MRRSATYPHPARRIARIGRTGLNADRVRSLETNPGHERLSDREFEVFRRLCAGESINRISETLSVSAKTVSTYKARILEKMQMPHEAALVRYAVRHKLFDDDTDDA